MLEPVGDFPIAVFDSNGDRVLTAGENTAASLWDGRTGTKLLSVNRLEPDWLASVRMAAVLQLFTDVEGLRLECHGWRSDPGLSTLALTHPPSHSARTEVGCC